MPLTVNATRRAELIAELAQQQAATANKPAKHRRDFTEEAVVRVWRDHNAVTTGHYGHAAMTIRGPSIYHNRDRGTYISWWPDDGAGIMQGVASVFGARQTGTRGSSYKDDKDDELGESAKRNLAHGIYTPQAGQRLMEVGHLYDDPDDADEGVRLDDGVYGYVKSAEAKVRLPGVNADRVHFGLDVDQIAVFWTHFLTNNPYYQLASHTNSCAGVVRQALKAGGAKAYAISKRDGLFTTPSEMESWAEALRLVLDDLNRDAANFMLVTRDDRAEFSWRNGGAVQVPTLDEWRRLSKRPRGGRGHNVTEIDAHLRDYHRGMATHKDTGRRHKARVKIFKIVQRAIGRQRNDYDRAMLIAIGEAILENP